MRPLFLLLGTLASPLAAIAADLSNGADNFYASDKVTVEKVTFTNQYQMKVAGNLFIPLSPPPLLFITGDGAHSREFSEEAYRLAAEPKELFIVPGAGHVDLYDRVKLIPFEKLTSFFEKHL